MWNTGSGKAADPIFELLARPKCWKFAEQNQAPEMGRMEVLRDTKEIEEDVGKNETTYRLKLKELGIKSKL